MTKVELRKVGYDIYERECEFVLLDYPQLILWARSINPYKWIDTGIHHYDPTVITDADIYIEFVREIDLVENEVSPILVQERRNSSLCCIGVIEKLISEDSFICNIGEAGSILVELERSIDNLKEGMCITFTGGLFIEFSDEFLMNGM